MNNETVKLWCIKADNDLKTGRDEIATENPVTDTVCFHMQQCVEKYLKAYLIYNGKEISKTHNCAVLLQQCITLNASFAELKDSGIAELTAYAVGMRYPDDFYMPSVDEALRALKVTETVRSFVQARMQSDGE